MTEPTPRLTKREKRLLRQQTRQAEAAKPNFGLELRKINPLTQRQKDAFAAYDEGKDLMLHGIAGTGKTFLAMYLALRELLSGMSNQTHIVIVRSVVEIRKMGYLPGTEQEKAQVYEQPYEEICRELFGRGDAYELLKRKGLIKFISTSFIRGVTLNDAIIVVDEMNNMNFHELDTIITRLGKNSKIVFCGDYRQSDFTAEQEKAGLKTFMKIINAMNIFSFIDFQAADIVRSGKVKNYIMTKDRLNIG